MFYFFCNYFFPVYMPDEIRVHIVNSVHAAI